MLKIGLYNNLEVYREVDFGVYLTDDEEEVLLPRKYVPQGVKIGDRLDVFIYLDSEERPIATTLQPKAIVGDTALLKVVDVNRVGAFLDWGLEKDLMVPFKQQRHPMVKGESYVVRVIFDRVSERLIASDRLSAYAKPGHGDLKPGQEVEILLCYETEIGYAVLIDNQYHGMLYKSDIFKPVNIGDRMTGYILKLRQDGKNDITLRRPGFRGVSIEKPAILEKLQEAGGFLPFNSQSSPEEIKKNFNLSKKVFKQAIGSLYKERLIIITDDGIKLPG